MNGEIKFRAWLWKHLKVVNVIRIDFEFQEITYQEIDFEYEDVIREKTALFKDISLLQYTGLKDKNGVKIFEGDILRIYGGEKMFGYYEFDQVKVIKELEDLVILSNLDYEIEVIGNIYENKELLNE